MLCVSPKAFVIFCLLANETIVNIELVKLICIQNSFINKKVEAKLVVYI